MNHRKLQIILISMLVLLTFTTVAYAYTGPALGSRILRYGMIGGDVRDLQTRLNVNGYNVGYSDGIFGLKTLNGVKNFQLNKGLVTDGIVGSLTLAKLKSTNSNPSTPPTPPTNPPAPTGKTLKQILAEKGIIGQIPNLQIVVDKSAHILTLYSGATPLKTYRISLGDGGMGDKVKAGDHKTPEGQFYISERSVLTPTDQYLGTRWMRVSYPNKEDADRGLAAGLIDQATHDRIYSAINNKQIPPQNTALGGGIGIHGGADNNGTKDWTWGCMALTNAEVNEIFDYVGVGTSLQIHS